MLEVDESPNASFLSSAISPCASLYHDLVHHIYIGACFGHVPEQLFGWDKPKPVV